MINRVARRINRENRRVPIFTIHDSIVTVVDRENYIRQVLKEEMQKGIGYVGTVQSEYWIYQKSGIDQLRVKFQSQTGTG